MKDKFLILIALILGFGQTTFTAMLSISIMSAIIQPKERVVYVTPTSVIKYVTATIEPANTLVPITAVPTLTRTLAPTRTSIPSETYAPTYTPVPIVDPVKPTKVPDPTEPSYPPDITAICKDGTYSYSKHASGTCSGHKGVKEWINKPK